MNKKQKIILIIAIIVIFVVSITVGGYFVLKKAMLKLSDNISLDTDNYLTAVEVNSDVSFILLINNQQKISNIIYLNDKSVEGLYKKGIENNSYTKGIPLIIENLKNSNYFQENVILIDYGNEGVFSKIKEEFNKQFVIYGINKQITSDTTTLNNKVQSLGLTTETSNQINNLKFLYSYSLDVISSYRKLDQEDEPKQSLDVTNIDQYASNVYNKLLTYSKDIESQTKDAPNGIDITTINASGDYQNELYALSDSWYYIDNFKVYAYIHFQQNNEDYNYCFAGTTSYTKSIC